MLTSIDQAAHPLYSPHNKLPPNPSLLFYVHFCIIPIKMHFLVTKTLTFGFCLLLGSVANALPAAEAVPAAVAAPGPNPGPNPMPEAEILPRDAAESTEATIYTANDTQDMSVNDVGFCFRGWPQRNYQPRDGWVEACCPPPYTCCNFYNDILNNHLYSAKATVSTRRGVNLWTGKFCTGESLWVDFDGWFDLGNAPAFYSMSM